MKFQFLFLFLFSCFASYAQQHSSFEKGLIITQKNDTDFCMVPSRFDFGDKVDVKTFDGKNETFLVSDIKYLATATQVFESIKFNKGNKEYNKLLRLEIEGVMNLYNEVKLNSNARMKPIGNYFAYTSTFDDLYVIKKYDKIYYIDQFNFEDDIKPLIYDNPKLMAKVENGFLTYLDIKDIVKEYNVMFEPSQP